MKHTFNIVRSMPGTDVTITLGKFHVEAPNEDRARMYLRDLWRQFVSAHGEEWPLDFRDYAPNYAFITVEPLDEDPIIDLRDWDV